MGEMSLSGLEQMQGEANKKFIESYDAAQKASEKAAAAEEAFYKAAQDYTFGDMSDESFQKKEAAQKKRTDLIDLYTSGDIDRDEFTALRAKYDAEIDSLKSMVESMKKQQVVIAKQQELMEDIKNAVDELIGGIEYEDEFYTQLLDKMVINDRENIDVYLNLLPLKWSYTVAGSINCLKDKQLKKALASENAPQARRNISEASLPISVSSPATSL